MSLPSFSLADRAVIVTGASSGLGVAFAEAVSRAGAHVVVCARRADRLDRVRALVESHGRRCATIRADVTDANDCALVAQTPAGVLLLEQGGGDRPHP